MTTQHTTDFAPTNLVLTIDRDFGRRVYIPSAEAMAWDGAGETTNATIYSDRHGVHCYAELRITGRGARNHPGGIYGWTARVRFTGTDDTGEWIPAVVQVGS